LENCKTKNVGNFSNFDKTAQSKQSPIGQKFAHWANIRPLDKNWPIGQKLAHWAKIGPLGKNSPNLVTLVFF
jgi:hypothetical protein